MIQPQHKTFEPIPDEVISARQQLGDLRAEFREFVYRVSHDVNAPMRSVVNFSELLTKKYSDALLDTQAQDYLDYITKGVRQAQDMLASLLEYSRVDTLSNPPTEIDCNLMLERCLRQLRPLISKTEALITSDTLPMLVGGSKQLEKLFCVLIENALNFRSPKRPPEITIHVESTQDAWLFSVIDNGIGIDPKYHQEIFQVFRYVHNDLGQAGIGMGLALARKIVHHHRGEIWLASELDKGTIFYFTLPSGDLLLKEGLL